MRRPLMFGVGLLLLSGCASSIVGSKATSQGGTAPGVGTVSSSTAVAPVLPILAEPPASPVIAPDSLSPNALAASPSLVASSPGPQIVPVSTPPSVVVGPACRASQLSADLEDFEEAGDSNYGWMIIRDMSGAACQLTGTIGIVGLDATGTIDTITDHAVVAGGLLLSANAATVPNGAMPLSGERVAFMVPGSSDSITNGARVGYDCPASDEVVPVTFRLDINGTGTITTSNGQPSGSLSHLRICQGQLDAGGPVIGQR